MDLEWTQGQLKEIEDQYFSKGYAVCPNDGSHLKLSKTHFIGSRVPHVQGVCPRCGRQFANGMIDRSKPASPFELKYESIRELGQGGMGVVSLVRERATGAEFAAKLHLRRRPLHSGRATTPRRSRCATLHP